MNGFDFDFEKVDRRIDILWFATPTLLYESVKQVRKPVRDRAILRYLYNKQLFHRVKISSRRWYFSDFEWSSASCVECCCWVLCCCCRPRCNNSLAVTWDQWMADVMQVGFTTYSSTVNKYVVNVAEILWNCLDILAQYVHVFFMGVCHEILDLQLFMIRTHLSPWLTGWDIQIKKNSAVLIPLPSQENKISPKTPRCTSYRRVWLLRRGPRFNCGITSNDLRALQDHFVIL